MATNFYIDNVHDKNGEVRIRVKISIAKVIYLTTTGVRINPKKWNKGKQRASSGYVSSTGITYTSINARLSDIETFFAKIENNAISDNSTLTKEKLTYLFNSRFKSTDKQSTVSFVDVFKRFISETSSQNNWSKASITKCNAVLNNILKFSPNPTFQMFNEKEIYTYIAHLTKRGLMNTTIDKNIGCIKQFLKWSIDNNIIKPMDVSRIKPKLKIVDTKVIYLTKEELAQMYSFEFPQSKNYLQRVRDVFCFCCYSSLRYSDVANLKRSNIYDDAINITTIKTNDTITIELNTHSRAILDKYKNEVFENNCALPVISNQKMNKYIKEVGLLCNIDTPITIVSFNGNRRIERTEPKYKLLSSHVARKTFVTSALSKGIEPIIVMQWTGHSDYKSMKPYIAIISKAKKDAMSLFNK